ncbi:response regulator transcription factor [Nitrosococcus oceani]|uniref:response regulator transcription factor n=1 Tax=Nitrosococcus oceani TaxID=1229 RepID=UPI0004E8CCA4|nr:LuxR C-terminal-related transcriptional regulator [Nitrosococcus oceani]KFI23831.1 LuxR family transcriptional regulator [Nitrosococcus oceani]
MNRMNQCFPSAHDHPGSQHNFEAARVFIVNSDEKAHSSLCRMIASAGWRTKSYFSAESFLDKFDPAHPGCLLLDNHVSEMGGLSLQQELRDRNSLTPVLFTSSQGTVPEAVEAIHGGAVNFFTRPLEKPLLMKCIRESIEKSQYLREEQKEREEITIRMMRLTPREREVMALVLKGQPNKLIASDLDISIKTVEIHRGQVMKKLQVRTQADLIHLALSYPSEMEH